MRSKFSLVGYFLQICFIRKRAIFSIFIVSLFAFQQYILFLLDFKVIKHYLSLIIVGSREHPSVCFWIHFLHNVVNFLPL